MPYTESGIWIPNLSPKQFQLFNTYKRFLLVTGPRYSTKTRGSLHRLARHAWETPNAKIGLFARTTKNLLIGAYEELVGHVLPEWEHGLEGFEIVKRGMNPTTRMEYCRITNMHGGISEFQVHSLDDESRIPEKMKATFFSCAWISELSNFKTRRVFDFVIPQLRAPGVPEELMMWMADTNPDEELGDDSWIYRLFYNERSQEDHPDPMFQKHLGVVEFTLDDNIFASEEKKAEIKGIYRHDPDLYAAMVEGKWVRTTTGALFSGIFSRHRHVIGDVSGLEPDEWEVALPSEHCQELFVGWDLGSSSHSVTILEKIIQPNGDAIWVVLDEICHVHSEVTIQDIALEVLERMDKLEEVCGRKFSWTHYSDPSAEVYRASVGMVESMIVAKATGGRIQLTMVEKGAGSVRLRANLLKQALQKGQFFVSAHCNWHIEMLAGGLKLGKRKNEYVKNNDFKHCFDSATYPMLAEAPFDLQIATAPRTGAGFDGIAAVRL